MLSAFVSTAFEDVLSGMPTSEQPYVHKLRWGPFRARCSWSSRAPYLYRSDRSGSELPETAVNTEVAQDLAKEFRQEMGPRRRRRPCRRDHRVPIGSCLLSTWTHQGGRTHGAACWAHRIVARARENCKNKTQNNAPRKFAIPNITFVKTGLQTLGT